MQHHFLLTASLSNLKSFGFAIETGQLSHVLFTLRVVVVVVHCLLYLASIVYVLECKVSRGDTNKEVVDHYCNLAYVSKWGKWHYYVCDTIPHIWCSGSLPLDLFLCPQRPMSLERCEWRLCSRGQTKSKSFIHNARELGNKLLMDDLLVDEKSIFARWGVDSSSHRIRAFVWNFEGSKRVL